MRILFICTGNVCRSPLAERLAMVWARAELAHSPEVDAVQIDSAGLSAVTDRPMDPHTVAALVELGGDPASFRSRAFTAELAEDADLVFTMPRDQGRIVLEATPRGLRRTFTLTEAALHVQQREPGDWADAYPRAGDLGDSGSEQELEPLDDVDDLVEVVQYRHAVELRRHVTTAGQGAADDPVAVVGLTLELVMERFHAGPVADEQRGRLEVPVPVPAVAPPTVWR